MSKETALAALQSLTDEEADILNSDPVLLGKFKQKHGLVNPPSLLEIGSKLNPMEMGRQLSPSNLFKLAGVASANAPDITQAAFNLPPIPFAQQQNVLPAIQRFFKDPGQAQEALMRMAQVNAGEPLTEKEVLPARIGQGAGTALEMHSMPTINTSGVKASGPFTAGFKQPSTAIPGSFDRAGKALNVAKEKAGAGINSPQVHNVLKKLETPKGARELLSEAREWVLSGMKFNISTAKAMGYKEVLGAAQAEGGVFANVYAEGVKKLNEYIAKRSPELAKATTNMATNIAAEGKSQGFPFLLTAIEPKVAAAKVATLPVVRNTLGAATGVATKVIPQASVLAKEVVKLANEKPPVADKLKLETVKKTLTRDEIKKMIKNAPGNTIEEKRANAKKEASDKGYTWPGKK